MKKWKVVITDREYEEIEQEKELLEGIGCEVLDYQVKAEEDVMEVVRGCDAVLTQYANITKRVMDAMPDCQIISKYAIGLDKIDIPAATERGICVANVRDYCIDEVSTHTVGLILNLCRKITFLNNTVKGGTWDYKAAKKIYNLRGMTLGLNSFGKIAQATAEKMKPFGVRLISFDPFVSQEFAARYDVELVSFDELCARSDILSTHAPANEDTKGMFDKQAFEKMKRTAVLINTGRGPVVDTPSLIWALQNRKIAGAALDVTEPEPIEADSPLLSMDQVIFTPHAAYYSEDSQRALQRLGAENIVQRLTGFYPRFLANVELKDRLGLKELPSDRGRGGEQPV